ncbi:TPA: hypothetical protein ACH3X1_016269 [Trebouxia sp. C0004]
MVQLVTQYAAVTRQTPAAKSHPSGSNKLHLVPLQRLRNLIATHPAALGVEWSNHLWDPFLPVFLSTDRLHFGKQPVLAESVADGIRTAHQLENADKEDLVAAGVTSAIHANDIKARAQQATGTLAGALWNLEALGDMIKELVVGGSGKLAKFFRNKIRNGGLLDATGKSEEVTGSLMLSLIIGTWTILQQFLPPERFVAVDYNKKMRVSATVDSIHDHTAGNYRPDMIIVTKGLLMFYGEEERENMEDQAFNDATRKFRHGLSPLFYGGIPYLPFYTATGNLVRFHLLLANGSVIDCQEVYNLQFEHHRAAFLLAVVHLQHLVQALLVRAPDRQLHAIQGVEDWQPTATVNTCIIRHRNEVHKYLYLWNSFASFYVHSFEDVQVQECLIKKTYFVTVWLSTSL